MYEFIGCAATNFCRGRPFGFRPEAIVVHIMGSTLADSEAAFLRPDTGRSAHYGVSRAGEIHQYVDENDSAFHAGIICNPTWPLLKPRANPNFYTIGVEHEGVAGQPCTEAQLCASAKLVGEIADRWGIALDEEHVIAHQQIRASRACPGESLAITELLKRVPPPSPKPIVTNVAPEPRDANGTKDTLLVVQSIHAASETIVVHPNGRDGQEEQMPEVSAVASSNGAEHAGVAAIEKPVAVRTLRNVKLRKSRPAVAAPLVRVIPAFTDIAVTAFEVGDPLEGNPYWYVDVQGNFFWAGATNASDPTALVPQRAHS